MKSVRERLVECAELVALGFPFVLVVDDRDDASTTITIETKLGHVRSKMSKLFLLQTGDDVFEYVVRDLRRIHWAVLKNSKSYQLF